MSADLRDDDINDIDDLCYMRLRERGSFYARSQKKGETDD